MCKAGITTNASSGASSYYACIGLKNILVTSTYTAESLYAQELRRVLNSV